MTTTIAQIGGGGSVAANALTGYRVERRSRNIVHEIAGGGTAVTLYGANLRSGRLEVLFEVESTAFAAFGMLARAKTFTLVSTERPSANMSFSVDENSITITLDPVTTKFWLVEFGFQEITP
jgi:hypothetical protein